jgi:hypothetical protein
MSLFLKLPRIEHTETLRRLVVTWMADQFSIRLPEVGLPHDGIVTLT